MTIAQRIHRPKAHVRPSILSIGAIAVAVLVAGCGNSEANASKGATQVAAKVNKEEISVHQINFVLQRSAGVTVETADAASRQILDRLINQELAVQKAQELKLDRNPAVVQAMEAARREVLARAYTDKLGEGISKPTPQEVAEFYAKRPALFKDRKVYALLEANIIADAAQTNAVRQNTQGKSGKDFVEWLKTSGLRHQVGQANQAAENLPLEVIDQLAQVPDGQALVLPQNGGVKVIYVLQSQRAPIEEANARQAIEAFIVNDRKRQKIDADMKALRAGAKIEMMGKFAEAAPAAAASPTAQPVAAPANLGADSVSKGLGLK